MAIVLTLSNHFKFSVVSKAIDLAAAGDMIKVLLMDASFAFDPDSMAVGADVTGGSPEHQLPTSGGYTLNNKTLANQVVAEDDANNKAHFTCDDISWTATAGGFGPTGSAVLLDTTADVVIGCIDFGSDFTIPDGSVFQITDIEIDLT